MLGLLEKLYTARHSMNFYYSVMVLCSYRIKQVQSPNQVQDLLLVAIANVIRQHPPLCFGIHGETTNNPSYVPVETIDLASKIDIVSEFTEHDIISHLMAQHDLPWASQETVPPWKLIVYPTFSADQSTLHIAFMYHHALADGLSGAAFHSSLEAALNEAAPSQPSCPSTQFQVQHPLSLTPPIEELVKFHLSWGYLLGKVLEEYGPQHFFGKKHDHFAGSHCEVSDAYPYHTQLRLLTVNPVMVKSLLSECKSKQVSTSVLLSLLVARSLAIARGSADAFIGSLPYTLRRVSGTDYQRMVNQTSALETEYSSELLGELCNLDLDRNDTGGTAKLWSVAVKESTRLKLHLDTCRTNNLVGLLPYVSDHHEFYKKKLGKKRELTFELSNIGVVKSSTNTSGSWNIERAIFTQGAAVVGPALNVNVASVHEGPMSITFSWQDKVIAEDVVTSTMTIFESTLGQLASQKAPATI